MLNSEQLKVPHFFKSFAHTGPWLHLSHKRLVHTTSIYCVWGISFVCLKEASGNLSWCLQTENWAEGKGLKKHTWFFKIEVQLIYKQDKG